MGDSAMEPVRQQGIFALQILVGVLKQLQCRAGLAAGSICASLLPCATMLQTALP